MTDEEQLTRHSFSTSVNGSSSGFQNTVSTPCKKFQTCFTPHHRFPPRSSPTASSARESSPHALAPPSSNLRLRRRYPPATPNGINHHPLANPKQRSKSKNKNSTCPSPMPISSFPGHHHSYASLPNKQSPETCTKKQTRNGPKPSPQASRSRKDKRSKIPQSAHQSSDTQKHPTTHSPRTSHFPQSPRADPGF
ncbi:hypothetical protein K458DRAFT_94149 [Lentithecium fluviatile CBS 122367]|uniref:Uncharacterized protein n=1 Tax=Lentithecium fluviatile CBS 122367 TaxID=1168545 RepID=A0A6G1IQ44_9PLEO|nr:hypothetical protein K458DRAFT_94149 [Lentithecium fluviatile CBS 122367]